MLPRISRETTNELANEFLALPPATAKNSNQVRDRVFELIGDNNPELRLSVVRALNLQVEWFGPKAAAATSGILTSILGLIDKQLSKDFVKRNLMGKN